ncbi:MAG TPA: FAD-dependent oxidoreductase, partial [Flavilitoribacter sp.]|nr:FAD-dependent oxidoreductase [Flavilitoribacter sp.]
MDCLFAFRSAAVFRVTAGVFCFWLSTAIPARGQQMEFPVIIAGGGASGTAAALQCTRMGVPCVLLEETPWLGGMLTSAGVSAVDGNHQLPSGIW